MSSVIPAASDDRQRGTMLEIELVLGRTMQSTVVSTRGTPAAGHPARRGSDPVIAVVRVKS